MKAKNFCVIFAIIAMIFSMTCAEVVTLPDAPRDTSISVQYVRQPPIDYPGPDAVDLKWFYTGGQGAVGMGRIAEDQFGGSASIKTETEVSLNIVDHRKYTECGTYVRKLVTVDGYTYLADSNCGSIKLIKHNDNSIEFK